MHDAMVKQREAFTEHDSIHTVILFTFEVNTLLNVHHKI